MTPFRGRSRQEAVTPGGLRSIEKGEMELYDKELYANINTGVLEQYLDEKGRTIDPSVSRFSLLKLMLMIFLVGVPFTFVTQYIALKFGLVLAALFYVAYLIALSMRWRPNEVNILSSATNLVDQAMTSFVFVFPVIYLLAYSGMYALEGGERIIPVSMVPDVRMMAVIILVSTMAGAVALFYFIIYRRLWVVEDPLPTPGFESLLKLMELARSVHGGMRERARSAIRMLGIAGIGAFVFSVVREFPLFGRYPDERSILDRAGELLGLRRWIAGGDITVPLGLTRYTRVGVSLSALAFATGWYMRRRIALYFFAGSAFMWFFLVPIAQLCHVPYLWPMTGDRMDVNLVGDLVGVPGFLGIPPTPPDAAGAICVNIAIGCLLGAGLVTITKFVPSLRSLLGVVGAGRSGSKAGKVGQDDGYEWPIRHIPYAAVIGTVGMAAVLVVMGGFPILPSLALALFLSAGAFLLHGISVKIAGSSGFTPTLMMVSLSLIALFVLLGPLGDYEEGELPLLVLVGTIAFTAAMVIPVTAQWDFKTALYIGTRPRSMFTAQLIALTIGIPTCAVLAALISQGLAKGVLQINAPQPYAFSTLVVALSGGEVHYTLIGLGIAMGVFIELLTGKGTIFGIGMFYPIGLPIMLLIGGTARDIWERRLDLRYGKVSDVKTMRLLDSYMVMTGLFVGEAALGLVITIKYLI